MTTAPPSPYFHGTPRGGRSATTYNLTCNRPHTRRIFSGIGFRIWNLRPQSQDLTTRPPGPHLKGQQASWMKFSTRRLFWDGPHSFEPQSDDGRHPSWHPFSDIPHHTNTSGHTPFLGRPANVGFLGPYQREVVSPPTFDLKCNRPNTRRIFS
ncbi:hypothetical protein AVEN_44656-1 [Araneus ventricosus]|uniref:Uncharacterized protein n=1 Tax=Araneus ventricosus TaxID=182803 RepID=A0A4Y2GAZ0_ARAVE|nr:hypothetical protein AVEN_44656-1 [Araneus ventricosus]